MLEKNNKQKFLSRFRVTLPNGEQVLLLTQGGQLACETKEDKHKDFLTDLEMRLGQYSYLKKEVLIILSDLEHIEKLHKPRIKRYIRDIISHKLKIEGKNRKERYKIENDLFDILNLHGYIVEKPPTNMDIRESFVIGQMVNKVP